MTALTEAALETVSITIEDPRTGLDIDYRVSPAIASAAQELIMAAMSSAPGAAGRPKWDSACRLTDED